MAAKDHFWVARRCHFGQCLFGQTPLEKESEERGRRGEKRERREMKKGEERRNCNRKEERKTVEDSTRKGKRE